MKKTYEKPLLAKAADLPKATAQGYHTLSGDYPSPPPPVCPPGQVYFPGPLVGSGCDFPDNT